MPLADSNRIAFLESIRDWYLFHLGGIHSAADRGDGLRLLLDSPLDEIPVTMESISQIRNQLERYASGDMDWTISAADALITDICVLRDWGECCVNDQFDLEFVFDTDASRVVKTCMACGYTLDTAGHIRERPKHYHIARRSELKTAGAIEDTT